MSVIEIARPYWLIAKRFHNSSRDRLRRASTVFEMRNLEVEGGSDAVMRRVKSFISKHQVSLPGNPRIGGGGDVA